MFIEPRRVFVFTEGAAAGAGAGADAEAGPAELVAPVAASLRKMQIIVMSSERSSRESHSLYDSATTAWHACSRMHACLRQQARDRLRRVRAHLERVCVLRDHVDDRFVREELPDTCAQYLFCLPR